LQHNVFGKYVLMYQKRQ